MRCWGCGSTEDNLIEISGALYCRACDPAPMTRGAFYRAVQDALSRTRGNGHLDELTEAFERMLP